ncbi:hypothetical protein LTR37_006725 [Vermiconidia calcicola]|uniref:Uncharacterized protein n=1 Tax=Vermiconidia calcicola TaxID=1690605 RepID=A0ACC3NFF2_9PEZI|nr:hypothetical protein LTR37_006725 [Vermiconidia calcicola]
MTPSCAQPSGKHQLTNNAPVLPIVARRSKSFQTTSIKSRAYSLSSPSGDVGVIETAKTKYARATNIVDRMRSKIIDLSRLRDTAADEFRMIFASAPSGPTPTVMEYYLSLTGAYTKAQEIKMMFESAGSVHLAIERTLRAADKGVNNKHFPEEEMASIRYDVQALQCSLLRRGEYAMGCWREFEVSMDRAIMKAEGLVRKNGVELKSMIEELHEVKEGLGKLVIGAGGVLEPPSVQDRTLLEAIGPETGENNPEEVARVA